MNMTPLAEKLVATYGVGFMPTFVVKHGEWYFLYTTDGGNPITSALTRDELRAIYLSAYGYEKFLTLEEQLLRAEKYGTSVPWPTTAEELLATNQMIHTTVDEAGAPDDGDDVFSPMDFESVIHYVVNLRSEVDAHEMKRLNENLAKLEIIEVPYQVRLIAERVQHYENLCEAEKKALKNVKEPDYEKMSTAHMQANVWRAALVLVIESFGLEPGKVIAKLNT